jgi:hypothetical protein
VCGHFKKFSEKILAKVDTIYIDFHWYLGLLRRWNQFSSGEKKNACATFSTQLVNVSRAYSAPFGPFKKN